MPTREDIWGLVINEAMAQGLPVITTNKCIAGLELIKNNKTGFLVEVENKEKLYDLTNRLLIMDFDEYNKFRLNLLKIIKKNTIETMAYRHFEIFNTLKEECV